MGQDEENDESIFDGKAFDDPTDDIADRGHDTYFDVTGPEFGCSEVFFIVDFFLMFQYFGCCSI